jgi:excisionase family DNA binding protein
VARDPSPPSGTVSTPARFDQLPLLLTATEAAALLRTTRRAVYARAERGLLPGALRDGRRLLVCRDDLLRYLEDRLAPPSAGPSTGRGPSLLKPRRVSAQLPTRRGELPSPPDETAAASPRR